MDDSEFAQDEGEAFGDSSGLKGLLWRKSPYLIVLALTIFGVAYTGISHKPLPGYWEFLAFAIGIACIMLGRSNSDDPETRNRVTWTQAVHWVAVLVAMNMALMPGVQNMMTTQSTGLMLLLLLALGTFLAGVQVSLQICYLGVAMALSVPALAWFKQYALLIALAGATVVGFAFTFWRRRGGAAA